MSQATFTFLDDESKEHLEADNKARTDYLDLLMFMHDLLCELGSSPERSRFQPHVVFARMADMVYSFPTDSQLGTAARANIDAAERLHSTLGRNFPAVASTAKKAPSPRRQVDAFLGNLLAEYDNIRVIHAKTGETAYQ